MSTHYNIWISSAPLDEDGWRKPLPLETVATVVSLLDGQNYTIDDIQYYIECSMGFTNAPDERYQDVLDGQKTQEYYWRLLADNPKNTFLQNTYSPNSYSICLGSGFSKVVNQFIPIEEQNTGYGGITKNLDALEEIIMEYWWDFNYRPIYRFLVDLGFDSISWS